MEFKTKEETHTLCVEVPQTMEQKLRQIAKENRISMSEVVRTFINEGFKEYAEVKKA